MVKSYASSQLLARVKSLQDYDTIPKDYWILGVRSKADLSNRFDDKFYIFQGEKFIMVTSGTTNPGVEYLTTKMNSKGAFIIKSDMWHYDLWKNGLHKAKMKALVQNRAVIGFRDNNRNVLSEEIGSVVSGWYGINFHASTYNVLNTIATKLIGLWSAGCQVVNDRQKYNQIIELVKNQKTITYCLLKEF